MITSIKGIAYKFLKSNKIILLTSIIAIFISTTLIIGMYSFVEKSYKNLQEDIISKYGIQDISVGYETYMSKSLSKEELKKIDKDFRVEIVEEYEELKNSKLSLSVFVGFFGFLILLISSLFINSNMQNLLYKYKDQFALLRSIGASGKNIFQLLFIQSTIINFIGVATSIIFSLGIGIINTYGLITAIIIFLILELFTILSPIKGLKVMPLNSFRENELSSFKLSKWRKNLGIALGIASIFIIIVSVVSNRGENDFICVFVASIVLVISFVMTLPFMLNRIMDKLLGGIGKIISSKRRNYLCVLIITVTTIIAVFGNSFLGIINRNSRLYLKALYPKDITVQVQLLEKGEGEEVYSKIEDIENTKCTAHYIDYVSIVRENDHSVSRENNILGFNMRFDNTVREDEVILLKEIADRYRINKGDVLSVRKSSLREGEKVVSQVGIPVAIFDIEVAKVKVKDIVEKVEGTGFYYEGIMNIKILEELNGHKDPTNVYIETDYIDEVKSELKELRKEYPEIYFGTYAEELRKDQQEMDKRWGIFKLAIAAMTISTFFGVYNMIVDYLYSRKEELSTLRDLGLTKRRLTGNIGYMLIVYFIIGIISGSILGILISTLLSFTG